MTEASAHVPADPAGADRYTTMSIASLGAPVLPLGGRRPKPVYATRPTNSVADILGATPASRTEKFTNKPVFSQADVEGSTPKVLIRGRNVPDLSLCIDDIPGTRFAIKNRFLLTKREVNPLVPEYTLPSYVESAPEQPRFIRDNIDVSDIEGTKTKVPKVYAMRDTIGVDDIEGAKPGWKPAYK